LVDAVPRSEGRLYFAFTSYTTLGYGDVVASKDWLLLGPASAMNAILMFGRSTAVIFQVMGEALRLKPIAVSLPAIDWYPAEQISAPRIAHQRSKIDKGLAALEVTLPSSMKDAGAIAVASMLGYLDLRDKQPWREKHPNLAAWFLAFAASTPAFAETAPGKL
jgi:hypothetical protein